MVNNETIKFITNAKTHYMSGWDNARVVATERTTALGVQSTTMAIRKLNDDTYEVSVDTYTKKTLGDRGRSMSVNYTLNREQIDILKAIM